MLRAKGQDLLGIGGILWAVCVLSGYVHVESQAARYGSALGGAVVFISWVLRKRAERQELFEAEKSRSAQARR